MIAATTFFLLMQSSSPGTLVLQTGHPQTIHDLSVSGNERVATASGADTMGTFAVWDAALRQIGWVKAPVDKSSRATLSMDGSMLAYSHLHTGYLNIDLLPVAGKLGGDKPLWRFRVGSGYAEGDVKPGIATLHWFGNADDPMDNPVAFVSQTKGMLAFRVSRDAADRDKGQLVDSKHFLEKDGAAIAACIVPSTMQLAWLSYDRARKNNSPPRLWRYHPKIGKQSAALAFEGVDLITGLGEPWVRMSSSKNGDRFLLASRSAIAVVGERNAMIIGKLGDGNLGNYPIVDAAISPDGTKVALAQELRPLAGERSTGIEIRSLPDLRLIHRIHRGSGCLGIAPDEELRVSRLAWNQVPGGSVITATSPARAGNPQELLRPQRNLVRLNLNDQGEPVSARTSESRSTVPPVVKMDSLQKWLAIGSHDQPVAVFSLESGRPASVIPGTLGKVKPVDGAARELAAAADEIEFDPTGRYAAFHHPYGGFGLYDLEVGDAAWFTGAEHGRPIGFLSHTEACFEFRSGGARTYRRFDTNGQHSGDLGTFNEVRTAVASTNGLHLLHTVEGTPYVRHVGGSGDGRVALRAPDAFEAPMGSSKTATQAAIVHAAISENGAFVVTTHHQALKDAKDGSRYALWDGNTGQLLGLSWTLRPIEHVRVTTKGVSLGLSDGTIFVCATNKFGVGNVPVNAVATSSRGGLSALSLRAGSGDETILATHSDGSVVGWSMSALLRSATQGGATTTEPLFTLMMTIDRNWAVSDQDLRYDAANVGEFPGILWNVGGRGAALNDYAEGNYEPGLLAKSLRGVAMQDRGHLREVRAPLAIGWLDKDTYRARLVDEPGRKAEAGRATLLVNGIPRLELREEQLKALADGTFALPLADPAIARATPAGHTPTIELKAVAPSMRLLASQNAKLIDDEGTPRGSGTSPPVVKPEAVKHALTPRRIAALCIGATVYSDRPLSWADDDAIELANLLRRADAGDGSMVRTLVSTSGEPISKADVTQAIRQWKEQVARLGADDTAILFLSGHGRSRSGVFEFVLGGNVEQGEGLTSAEIADAFVDLNRIGCVVNNRALVVDACYAGQARESFLPLELAANRTQGRFYFLGASKQETREYATLRHGALTFALMDACQESAAIFMSDYHWDAKAGLSLQSWFEGRESHLRRVLLRLGVSETSAKVIGDSDAFYAGSIDTSDLFASLNHTGLTLVHASGNKEMDDQLAKHSDARSGLPYFFTKSYTPRPGLKVSIRQGPTIQAELVETDSTFKQKPGIPAPEAVKSISDLWPWFEIHVKNRNLTRGEWIR